MTAIDGTLISAGTPVAVANGSVTLNADGTLTFTPTANFNGQTSFTYQAGHGLRYQFFDATGFQNDFASVDEIPTVGNVRGFVTDFNVNALALNRSVNTSFFGIRYTGAIDSRPAAPTRSTRHQTTARRSISTASGS